MGPMQLNPSVREDATLVGTGTHTFAEQVLLELARLSGVVERYTQHARRVSVTSRTVCVVVFLWRSSWLFITQPLARLQCEVTLFQSVSRFNVVTVKSSPPLTV